MSINKFHGIGNVGKEPEMRFMPDGKAVSNFSFAITEKYKDKHGEAKEVTEWVNVVAFGKLAEICGEWLHKGQQVYVEGKLKTETYEKDGIKRYSTKIIAEKMQMLGGKSERNDTKRNEEQPPASYSVDDSDIPF